MLPPCWCRAWPDAGNRQPPWLRDRPRPAARLKPLSPEIAAAVRAQADDAAKKEEENEGFRFPDDKGGQILARELPPADRGLTGNENVVSAPRRLPGVAALEHPTVPLPPNQGQVPRLPVAAQGPAASAAVAAR